MSLSCDSHPGRCGCRRTMSQPDLHPLPFSDNTPLQPGDGGLLPLIPSRFSGWAFESKPLKRLRRNGRTSHPALKRGVSRERSNTSHPHERTTNHLRAGFHGSSEACCLDRTQTQDAALERGATSRAIKREPTSRITLQLRARWGILQYALARESGEQSNVMKHSYGQC
jgi:hypothetical protein